MKQQIRVYFTDFWTPFDPQNNLWLDILRTQYDVVSSSEAPDFLFHSCFGHEHLRFDCVKICILGENLSPDFNISDYACGFDHLIFEDRYYRMPLYRLYMADEAYALYDVDFLAGEAAAKTKFCNFIYSNNRNPHSVRERFFDQLSRYKPVDSGGAFRNTIGHRVDDKRAWQRDYKFSIAFENSCKSGYTTEKIYDALCAHTIPIYWGNPRVAEDFNPGRFINCHEFASFDAVVERVRELDENAEIYREMLAQSWFANGTPPLPQNDVDFVKFLLSIIEQGPKKARQTTRNGFSSVYYGEQLWLARFAPLFLFCAKIHTRLRRKVSPD